MSIFAMLDPERQKRAKKRARGRELKKNIIVSIAAVICLGVVVAAVFTVVSNFAKL